jgi:hypothetical protein
MAIFSELFSSKEGLMSLVVIIFMLGMGVYFVRMFIKNMNAKPKQ